MLQFKRSLRLILFVLPFIYGLHSHSLSAQKALQFEKRSSLNTVKFYIGDEFTFKLNESKIWYTRMIHNINMDNQTILIENMNDDTPIHLPISNITHIQIGNRNKTGRIIGQALFVGGLNTALSSIVLARADLVPPLREDASPLLYGLGGSAVGYALWRLFSISNIKLNERKRIRLIDTTLYIDPDRK